MPRENFHRPRRATKEERGHRSTCVFTTNAGPACNCDELLGSTPLALLGQQEVDKAMTFNGWTRDTNTRSWGCFHRRIGDHHITIARVHSGWSIVWMRGVGWTIMEESGLGNPMTALTVFWEHVIAHYDQSDENVAELVQLRLAAAKAETKPRLESVPMPDDKPE